VRAIDNPLPRRGATGPIAGVCAGWADALAIDATLLRLAVALLALAWGAGLVLYVALWLTMPAPDVRRAPTLSDTVRDNADRWSDEARGLGSRLSAAWQRSGRSPWPVPLDRRWIGIALLTAGAAIVLISLGAWSWLTPSRALGLGLAAAGAAVIAANRSREEAPR